MEWRLKIIFKKHIFFKILPFAQGTGLSLETVEQLAKELGDLKVHSLLEFDIIENPKVFSYINHIAEKTTTPKLRQGINGIKAFIFSA